MMRKLRVSLFLTALATIVGAVGLQAPSYASAPNDSRQFFPNVTSYFDPENPTHDVLVFDLGSTDWPVGDCVLFGISNRVMVDYTSRQVRWEGGGLTHKTSNRDIWHSTFSFDGISVGTLDSKPMSRVEFAYGWTREMSWPRTLPRVSTLSWASHC